jgi:hypothetical protein
MLATDSRLHGLKELKEVSLVSHHGEDPVLDHFGAFVNAFRLYLRSPTLGQALGGLHHSSYRDSDVVVAFGGVGGEEAFLEDLHVRDCDFGLGTDWGQTCQQLTQSIRASKVSLIEAF